MIPTDPKILAIAFTGGLIPSLIWLFFWLGEEGTDPEPWGAVTIIFLLGMVSVLAVLPVQKLIQNIIHEGNIQLVLWATTEEVVKFLAVALILAKSDAIDEPTDWPIYLMTAALGFAAFENFLFLLKPVSLGHTTAGLINGQLRFLGSTLLHSISSGTIGIALGLSFYSRRFVKIIYFIIGVILAIALHSAFNFFIIRNNGSDFMKVLALLWVTTIMVMLVFEKLRRMKISNN
jgi:RsiW-degrading membrane proteinase PrsW (M82 family)